MKQNNSDDLLPEVNSEESLRVEVEANQPPQKNSQTSAHTESDDGDEMKAIAKAFAVGIAWSMVGLLPEKKE